MEFENKVLELCQPYRAVFKGVSDDILLKAVDAHRHDLQQKTGEMDNGTFLLYFTAQIKYDREEIIPILTNLIPIVSGKPVQVIVAHAAHLTP